MENLLQAVVHQPSNALSAQDRFRKGGDVNGNHVDAVPLVARVPHLVIDVLEIRIVDRFFDRVEGLADEFAVIVATGRDRVLTEPREDEQVREYRNRTLLDVALAVQPVIPAPVAGV